MSPTRFMTNALLPAVAYSGLAFQKAIKRYDAESDAFPTDVDHHVVAREHQEQHRGNEEVQVRKEPTLIRVVGHVSQRVHMDETPTKVTRSTNTIESGIELEAHIDGERTDRCPLEKSLDKCTSVGGLAEHLQELDESDDEGNTYERGGKNWTEPVGSAPPDQQHDCPKQRERDQHPDQTEDTGGRYQYLLTPVCRQEGGGQVHRTLSGRAGGVLSTGALWFDIAIRASAGWGHRPRLSVGYGRS